MIISRKLIPDIAKELKENQRTIVFTNGCFDILHKGHVHYMNEAKKLGDVLIIGLNTDSSVKRLKGPGRPVNIEDDRAFVLDNLKAVDYVVMFDEDTPFELIKSIVPDVLVKGGDYKPEDIVGYDIVTGAGGKVITIDLVEGRSTTKVIEKLQGNKD